MDADKANQSALKPKTNVFLYNTWPLIYKLLFILASDM
jgi:hypothetical protein